MKTGTDGYILGFDIQKYLRIQSALTYFAGSELREGFSIILEIATFSSNIKKIQKNEDFQL